MKTLNSHTGTIIIDHTNSPGISLDEVPLRLRNTVSIAKEGEIFERDTKVCTHCERGIILEPLRTRQREKCPYCYHYICDECHKMLKITGQCIPFKKIVDEAANKIAKGSEPLIII